MYIQNGNNNIIKDNYVTNLRYGLHYMYSDSNVFENNTFTNNLVGAAIMYSDNIIFKNNSFTHNRGFSSYGLLFQDCSGCLAENNYIIDNSIGMFLETANKNIFRNNIIACNDVSLQLFSSSDENIFYDNNFIDNLTQLTLVGKRTTTKWSHNNRGNYWSDYDGYDMDLDGIGDIPYKIYNVFELLEGNYPYVRLYLYSPASQSIEMAEKTFPVIQFSNEEDKYPLMMPAKVDMIHLNQSSIINRQVSISFGLGGILMVVFSIYVVYKKQLKNGKHCSTTF
jgi:nitrous oxidase accessory protein